MKREIAFALEGQCNMTDSLGRTRSASKVIENNRHIRNNRVVIHTVYKRKYKGSKKSDLLKNVDSNGKVDRISKEEFENNASVDEVSDNVENKRMKIENGHVIKTDNNANEKIVNDNVCAMEVSEKVDIGSEKEIMEVCANVEKIQKDVGTQKENDMVSIIQEETENDLIENVIAVRSEYDAATYSVQKSNEAPFKPLTSEEDILGTRTLLYDVKTLVGSPGKFSRRFTRSVLKLKVEPVESLDLMDCRSNEVTETAKIPECKVKETTAMDVSVFPNDKLELIMQKKVLLSKVPATVKELLETGLLEGHRVTYVGGKKRASGLQGRIQGVGILCSCSLCKGSTVIPPSQFEIHACNTYKRAAQYILLDNGKSFIEILNACRDSSRDTVGARIQNAISFLPSSEPVNCKLCNETFPGCIAAKIGPLCQSCMDQWLAQDSPMALTDTKSGLDEPIMVSNSPGTTSTYNSQMKQGRKKGKRGRKPKAISKTSRKASLWSLPMKRTEKKTSEKSVTPILVSKSLKKASISLSPKRRSQWKITKKDIRLHKLVFDEGGLPDGTELGYYARGKKLLSGYKKGSGIFCFCCNNEVSASQFEAHAGCATRRKPYSCIYTSNGVSLHELSISLLKGLRHSAKDNDDLCIICADGGNLLLCDGCPRAFHRECASLPSIPRGKWYCQYCQNMFEREKFVAHNANAVAAGRVSGVDPIAQITQRCIRIVKSRDTDVEFSACVLCRGHDFSKSGFGPRTIILCDQCEMEFHVGCLRKHKMADLKELPRGKWFCRVNCKSIHSSLKKLLVQGEEKLPDSLLDVVKKKLEEKGLGSHTDLDIRWRVLSGKITSPEIRPLLSKAVAIFHDCFDPIIDQTIQRDLIPSMVYGRTLGGQDFGGMYCAVLMVNSFVVSAGILRVYGEEVAEIPLVATCKDNQDKGYFQLLFSCIEKLLAYMNVKSIVLPAAEEAESIWTDKFGFSKIEAAQLINLRKNYYQMMTFQGTSMLQKTVPECRILKK